MARKSRDYRKEYRARVDAARRAGYQSPYERRQAFEQSGRSTAFTRAELRARANLRAQQAGFRNAYQGAKYRRAVRAGKASDVTGFLERDTLAFFKVSRADFDRMRHENRLWKMSWDRMSYIAAEINDYKLEIDEAVNDWSERRVGYIVSFHAAVVNPATNYDALYTRKLRGSRKTGHVEKVQNAHGKIGAAQYFYLVKYARIMQVDEFESRYGRGAIAAARKQKIPEE